VTTSVHQISGATDAQNKVNDPITDQEMAFARLVLSGGMTDRQAAEAAGLNPDSAAYTKSKPTVRAYMLEHRAAVQQQLVQQEADLSRLSWRAVEEQHRRNLDREKVLDRLWEIAYLSPEITRGSITGQVKALSMIVAMQNFIPDRRAASSQKKSVAAPAREEYESGVPEPNPAPASAAPAPPNPGPSQSTSNRVSPSQAPPRAPYVPLFASVPDLGVSFPKKLNPFVYPR
jgi:hypothetical protein